MDNRYHIDLANYSLQKFKRGLASRALIPSRVILKDRLDEHFAILEKTGISNLKELIGKLRTKSKIEQFSNETGLSSQYLTILKREANSYRPNPVRIDQFPGIESGYIHKLAAAGIRNSRQLFEIAKIKTEREQFAQKVGLPIDVMNELVCLSDLVRAYGVGPVFARLIFDVGIKTIQQFVAVTAEEFIHIYEKQMQKKADFGVNEIQFSLELAKELDIAVEL